MNIMFNVMNVSLGEEGFVWKGGSINDNVWCGNVGYEDGCEALQNKTINPVTYHKNSEEQLYLLNIIFYSFVLCRMIWWTDFEL